MKTILIIGLVINLTGLLGVWLTRGVSLWNDTKTHKYIGLYADKGKIYKMWGQGYSFGGTKE